jgi:DNA-binding HxlR family transcriptional regulator
MTNRGRSRGKAAARAIAPAKSGGADKAMQKLSRSDEVRKIAPEQSAGAGKARAPDAAAGNPAARDVYRVLRGQTGVEGSPVPRLIHQRTRLAIVSMLAVNESLAFNELKELLGATDGNLSVHARKLENAGYIDCKKSFEGRMPKTEYRITAKGQRALERYLDHMESLIQAVREG